MKRCESRTPATKRSLLKTVFNMNAAKKVEEIEKNLLKLEDIFTRCETMANNKLPEDMKTVIMMELRTPDLKDHLEFNLKDVGYTETREAVMAYVERKWRDPITTMENGNHENDYNENAGDWWGGDENKDNYGDNEEHYHHEVTYSGYGSKGFVRTQGQGNTSTWRRGETKVSEKEEEEEVERLAASTKAGARAKEAKANEVRKGHTASRCSDKDAYMECVRGGSGPANHSQETAKETYNLQNKDEEGWRTVGGSLSSLDKARCFNVCSLHAKYRKNFTML